MYAIWLWNMVSYINKGMQAKGGLKTGSWGEYLGLKGMRMGSGEGATMRNFTVYIIHLT